MWGRAGQRRAAGHAAGGERQLGERPAEGAAYAARGALVPGGRQPRAPARAQGRRRRRGLPGARGCAPRLRISPRP